ncbi:delta-like protein 3 [Strongylocentrotus purpuratus]|uniref:EGF-like domain-containing protein n=1 Tax=Strongylocentrotus purpuratus TaxID=7668 RepID=A0A7M7NFP3_STRPU|nr:delta-like protein 3 [Strongylocentrotus purpuratus]
MNAYMVGKENRSYHCYICHCTDSFIGQDCETSLADACSFDNLHVCENEGLCMEDDVNPGNVKCECQDGYGGLFCEESIPNACMVNNPCQNEGTCMEDEDNPGYVKCICPDGCGGLYCEEAIPYACLFDNPCQDKGTCMENEGNPGNVKCVCPDGSSSGLDCGESTPWYLKANVSIAALGGFAVFTLLVILIISCAKVRERSSARNETNVSDLLFAVGTTMAVLANSRQRPTPSVNNYPDPGAVAGELNVPNSPMRGVNRDQENRVQGNRVQRNGDQGNKDQGNGDQQNKDQENREPDKHGPGKQPPSTFT